MKYTYKLLSIFLLLIGLSGFGLFKAFNYLVELDKKEELTNCQVIVLKTWILVGPTVNSDQHAVDILNNLYKEICK